MKFMSWTLYDPTNEQFSDYAREISTGKWEVINPEAVNNWPDVRKNFWIMFTKYHEKITSIGLHDFGVNSNGMIYYYVLERDSALMLNEDETEIVYWIRDSMRYSMDNYPNVEWFMQFICMGANRLDPVLDNVIAENGERTQDNFIRQMKKLVDFYIERFPNRIKGVEVDFEKSSSRSREYQEPEKYRDLLKRVKDEVCIPRGLKLRVNLLSMTGDFNPSWYQWTDYRTLASGRDKNGNFLCDEWQIMSYDFAAGYSAPGPSTPLWWLQDVLDHATSVFPANSVWVGNAGYGRRWGLNDKRAGNPVTYKQMAMWQNGMYVHNHGSENEWIWHNQDWLPFTGWNDEESGYQVTYPHLYDRFDVTMSEDTGRGTVNRTSYSGKDIVTSYFKSQQPKFTGIRAILNDPNEMSGNVSEIYKEGVRIPAEYLGSDTVFSSTKRANKAVYIYDSGSNACVKNSDETGTDGNIRFTFNVANSGRMKLIALVHFNTFMNNEINVRLNGHPITIGGESLVEWWPFYVDKFAWLDVGEFDFEKSNTLDVKPSKGYIWGFVVCEEFEQNFLGGEIEFNSFLAPFKKRGEIDENGSIEKVTADMPDFMTLTGEILRREPRPAIIFEDNFSHYLNRKDVQDTIEEVGYYDLTREAYYLGIQDSYRSGPYVNTHNGKNVCTDETGIQRAGFSDGIWRLGEDGLARGSANAGMSSQILLHNKFACNIQIRADIAVSGTYPFGGVRFLASEEGNGNHGYLALLDYSMNKVSIVYEDGVGGWEEVASAWMSDQLIELKGQTVTMTVSVLDGKAWVRVGSVNYLSEIELPTQIDSGAYGVFVKSGSIVLSFLNISTLDRYEPLEKMRVEVDGVEHDFGEVPRTVEYDEFGYLIYSGLDINSIEIEEEGWSADYINEPLAVVPSWIGRKKIRVMMVDAGIWFSFFYIGDAEGYSVAWNSDLTGFITTSELINEYGCRGVAMWTIGQEDPLIFEYIPQ